MINNRGNVLKKHSHSLNRQLFAVILFALSATVNAQSFLCVDEHGVILDQDQKSKAWGGGFFNETKTRLTFKPDPNDSKSMALYSQENGKLMTKCQHWFADIGVAQCVSQAADVVFKFSVDPENPQEARFILSVLGLKYLAQSESIFAGPATSLLVQGKCFRVN